jgi:molecular chaperone DnaK
MMRDAEDNASSDKVRKELIEAKNQADSLIYETEKSLKEHGDKIDSNLKSSIETDLKDLKDSINKSDVKLEDIKSLTEKLMQNSMKIGEAVYKNSASNSAEQPQQNSTESSSEASKEKVVDGEYDDVKDDKKNN